MLVSDINLVPTGRQFELQAQVESNVAKKPFLLRYVFPRELEDFVSPENGDPFLAALLLPAITTRETLEIGAPVSPSLLGSVDELQTIYKSFNPKLSRVQAKALARRKQLSRNHQVSRIWLFFSCGVDSYYSILSRAGKRGQDEEAITDLIVGYGLDILYGKRNNEVFSKY